jgi:hypothetical protein
MNLSFDLFFVFDMFLNPKLVRSLIPFQDRRHLSRAFFWGTFDFMLPNPKNLPSLPAKQAAYALVSGLIGYEFLFPIALVGCRQASVKLAAVPETSVNEHRQIGVRKREIWLPRHWQMPPPSADFLPSQRRSQG